MCCRVLFAPDVGEYDDTQTQGSGSPSSFPRAPYLQLAHDKLMTRVCFRYLALEGGRDLKPASFTLTFLQLYPEP